MTPEILTLTPDNVQAALVTVEDTITLFDDLHTIAAWCQEHNMKSYLTVNTIIYEEDIEYMHSIVNAAKEAKVAVVSPEAWPRSRPRTG